MTEQLLGTILGKQGSAAAGIQAPNTAMTPDQTADLANQRSTLQDQRTQLLDVLKQNNLLSPALLSSLGFTQDAQGNITDTSGMTGLRNQQVQDVLGASPEENQLQSLLRQRQIQALQGDAQADPNLERNLGLQEQTLRNQLRAQLGDGYETSSAGIQALNDFRQRAEELRFQSRQGIIQNYSGAGAQNAGTTATLSAIPNATSNVLNQTVGTALGTANLNIPGINAETNVGGGFNQNANAYFNQTGLGTNAQLTQEQTRGNTATKLFGDLTSII